MVREKYLIKSLIAFMSVQVIVIRNQQGAAVAEVEDVFLQPIDGNDDDNDDSDSDDNNSDVETQYEPFDPEKSGFLLHEYFSKAYAKYPEYDTATMKQNLNYFGDILLYDSVKKDENMKEVDIGDQYVLDPAESEHYLKANETVDIQEAKNDDIDEAGDEVGNDVGNDVANEVGNDFQPDVEDYEYI